MYSDDARLILKALGHSECCEEDKLAALNALNRLVTGLKQFIANDTAIRTILRCPRSVVGRTPVS